MVSGHVIPTDARAPGNFRMITVEKAEEGRWLDSRSRRSSPRPVLLLSVSYFFHFLPALLNAALFSTCAS
jgi:hypothetical protein